jgi:hypothetical protein
MLPGMNRAGQRIRPTTARVAGVAAMTLATLVSTGCASGEPIPAPIVAAVPETVELGEFPEPPTDESPPVTPSTTAATVEVTPTTEPVSEPISSPIGDLVDGNRILLIGDTVIASTAPRFDGAMCDALEAFGWQAEIAAEPGRFVEFGSVVVGARVVPDEPDWDAVAIMLGNHFDGDVAEYAIELDALVSSLSPRPMLVYTLVEDDTFQADLNTVIRDLPSRHPHVLIVDWAEIVAAEPDVLTDDTPSGLSEEGRARLALFTVAELGEPPTIEAVGCVPPVFVDDSAIVL